MNIKPWSIFFEEEALKDFRKLDTPIQHQIQKYLRERLATTEDPRRFGKALRHDMKSFWRYRIGDYRIICRIEDESLVIVLIDVGHRRDIYD